MVLGGQTRRKRYFAKASTERAVPGDGAPSGHGGDDVPPPAPKKRGPKFKKKPWEHRQDVIAKRARKEEANAKAAAKRKSDEVDNVARGAEEGPSKQSKTKTQPQPNPRQRQQRTTRNNLGRRESKPPELYTDNPNEKAHPGNGGVAWNKKEKEIEDLQRQLEYVKISRDHYKLVAENGFAEIARRNAECVEDDYEDPMDRPSRAGPPPELSDQERRITEETGDLQRLIHAASKQVPKDQVNHVKQMAESLGLIKKGRVSNELRDQRLSQGIIKCFDYHYAKKRPKERGEILGNLLFQGGLFGDEVGKMLAGECAASVSRQVFTPQALLRSIDSSGQGSMNDAAVSDYARIEDKQGLTSHDKGKTLLPFRGHLTDVRKIMNDLAEHLFKLKHNEDKRLRKYGDIVKWDYERLIRYLLAVYSLTQKSVTEGNTEFISRADGSEVCGKYSSSQCAIGLQIVDIDAVDPVSGQPLYYDVVEIDGRERIRYKNYQTVDTLALAGICLKNETIQLLHDVFKDFYDFCNLLAKEGLPANGDEPALLPFKYESCADLCWNNKCVGNIGGACKVKALFCIYCEADGNSNTDLMRYVTGDAICDICEYNKRTKCPHRAVNDAKEILRKISTLTKLILDDHRKMLGDDTLDLKDILPLEPVDVLVGYENKQLQWEKVSLRDTISADGTCTLAPEEYIRHIRHTEEKVAGKTVMVYEPESLSKASDLNNIEFELGKNALEDSEFHSNVRMDLRERGFTRANGMMPDCDDERRALLLSCLKTKLLVDINRRAIKREEESKFERFVGPGNAIPCRLHFWLGLERTRIVSPLET